ncbi:hypothetical protein KZZ20_11170, partial [Methylacidiphilum fumariolicum]
ILRWVLSGQCRNIEGQLVCFEGAYPFGALDEPAAYFDKSAHLSDLEESQDPFHIVFAPLHESVIFPPGSAWPLPQGNGRSALLHLASDSIIPP